MRQSASSSQLSTVSASTFDLCDRSQATTSSSPAPASSKHHQFVYSFYPFTWFLHRRHGATINHRATLPGFCSSPISCFCHTSSSTGSMVNRY